MFWTRTKRKYHGFTIEFLTERVLIPEEREYFRFLRTLRDPCSHFMYIKSVPSLVQLYFQCKSSTSLVRTHFCYTRQHLPRFIYAVVFNNR